MGEMSGRRCSARGIAYHWQTRAGEPRKLAIAVNKETGKGQSYAGTKNRKHFFHTQRTHTPMTPTEKNKQIDTRLQEAFYSLSEIIRDVEESVLSMKVMRHVEYEYAADGRWIGVTKFNGAWRLCHATSGLMGGDDEEGYVLDWKPLCDVAAIDRIEALKHIESLREVIVESKEDLLVKIEEAIKRYQ